MFNKKKPAKKSIAAPEKGMVINCKDKARVFKMYDLCPLELLPIISSLIKYTAKQLDIPADEVIELLK